MNVFGFFVICFGGLVALFGSVACSAGVEVPIPDFLSPPEKIAEHHDVPVIESQNCPDGERITLRNDFMSVQLLIGRDSRVLLQDIHTKSGHQMLKAPASSLSLVPSDGTVITSGGKGFPAAWVPEDGEDIEVKETSNDGDTLIQDGRTFKVISWHPWHRLSYAEVEIRMQAPEPLTWHLRLYRDRPYLEQQFQISPEWRSQGRALAQNLPLVDSLNPVLPTNAFGRGFSNGRPNLPGRHRFEFVPQSDHVSYDAEKQIGIAAFVAGIGGEERICQGSMILLDHVTETLGSDEPPARFLIWPFEGPVQKGFTYIKAFIRDDYSCQGEKFGPFAWNQFWLWQGGPQPAGTEVVTATRLLDILPHIANLGCEEFHLDMGWEAGPGDWRFHPERFPQGFAPFKEFLRQRGMRYHTWMNDYASDDPDFLRPLIEQTDMCKLFLDRVVTEPSIASIRKLRESYPEFETFGHHTTSRSSYYPWGNMHFLSDINQTYFGEGQFWMWSNILPGESDEPDVNKRFFTTHSLRAGDLVTRTAAYQAHWVWPYKCIVPPHCGWAWFEERSLEELASRMFTTIAARYDYQWGLDPRLVRGEVLDFFLDWTAFFKTARPYLQQYQHVLAPPDGIHPDGAAHLIDGRGFVVLCNPSEEAADVEWKEILWEPELQLDPAARIAVTDWSDPLAPSDIGTVHVEQPEGSLALEPLSYRVIGLDIEVQSVLDAVIQERSKLHGPDGK